MRPHTLADAVEMIAAGSAHDAVLAEFIDAFDLAKTDQDRYAVDRARAEIDGRKAILTPLWVRSPSTWQSNGGSAACRIGSAIRRAACRPLGLQPRIPSDAMREYLTFSSPAEFASRNIFTEERPLRRARALKPAET